MPENGNERNQPQAEWHFDKTVNITVAAGFLGAIASGIWFAAAITTRVTIVEHQVEGLPTQVERIIRLETKMDSIAGSLTEIKALIRTPADQRR